MKRTRIVLPPVTGLALAAALALSIGAGVRADHDGRATLTPLGIGRMPAASQRARAAQAPSVGAVVAPPVDYNWDVRPILSENCFRCHGPDEKSRMAGLRLDVPDIAYAELKSGKGKHAIAPGHADESEVIRRVSAENAAVRMPPKATNKVL